MSKNLITASNGEEMLVKLLESVTVSAGLLKSKQFIKRY